MNIPATCIANLSQTITTSQENQNMACFFTNPSQKLDVKACKIDRVALKNSTTHGTLDLTKKCYKKSPSNPQIYANPFVLQIN